MLLWMMALRSYVRDYRKANPPFGYKDKEDLDEVAKSATDGKSKTWEDYLKRVVQVRGVERNSLATCLTDCLSAITAVPDPAKCYAS